MNTCYIFIEINLQINESLFGRTQRTLTLSYKKWKATWVAFDANLQINLFLKGLMIFMYSDAWLVVVMPSFSLPFLIPLLLVSAASKDQYCLVKSICSLPLRFGHFLNFLIEKWCSAVNGFFPPNVQWIENYSWLFVFTENSTSRAFNSTAWTSVKMLGLNEFDCKLTRQFL